MKKRLYLYINGVFVMEGSNTAIYKRIVSEVEEHKKQMHFYGKSEIERLKSTEKINAILEKRNMLVSLLEPDKQPKYLKVEITCKPWQ